MSFNRTHSKINREDFRVVENIKYIYKDSKHISFYKRFPTCNFRTAIPQGDYRIFYLRCYMPTEKLLDNDPKIENLVIMFNGLNETDNYALYDQLGSQFAAKGIASILLPLPDHFNRNPFFRRFEMKEEDRITPFEAMYLQPIGFYERYLQYMDEINLLLRHISRECKSKDENCSFFNTFFNKDTKVSCLGYSLGGLAALSTFLINRKAYQSCIVLNSGISLARMAPTPIIESSKWDKFVMDLEEQFDKQEKKTKPKKIEKYSKIFGKVFFDRNIKELRIELIELAKKILFVFGGKDRLIPFEEFKEFEVKEHGLTIFKIPGLDHFLYRDAEWAHWSDIIVNLIQQFNRKSGHEYLTADKITDQYIELNKKYNLLEKEDFHNVTYIQNETEKETMRRILFAYPVFFDISKNFIKEVNRKIEERKK